MTRSIFTCMLLSLIIAFSFAQPKQVSVGIFSGITVPFTWDEGINKDARYKARYDIKAAPIGVSLGIDFQGYGFVLNPSLITIGQNQHVINTVGGHEGTRNINLKYLQIPLALKVHVIDLAFFKVSFVGGIALGYLLDGEEHITHNYAKFRFRSGVYPVLPPDYIVEYDGILAPEIKKHQMVGKNDFNKLQLFTSLGLRSDWDVSENWRITIDLRGNYGTQETRTNEYLKIVSSNQKIYDYEGKRREIFATFNIGISRYLEIDSDKNRKTKSFKSFKPKKYPWVAPNRSKPK